MSAIINKPKKDVTTGLRAQCTYRQRGVICIVCKNNEIMAEYNT